MSTPVRQPPRGATRAPATAGEPEHRLGCADPDRIVVARLSLGRRLHPGVHHYRDGGFGGLGPDHSVVGFVPVSTLTAFRHHDGTWQHPAAHQGTVDPRQRRHDLEVIAGLRAVLRDGAGFHTPLMLEYDPDTAWAYLGEGNHRLAAAAAEQVSLVPVRVVRSQAAQRRRDEGIGAPATHVPIPGAPEGYFPSDAHPAYLRLL